MSVSLPVLESVEEAGLVYSSDSQPGIRREPKGDGFEYYDPRGKRIEDEKTLERIRSLAIPPAYAEVWICPDPRGHLQATGKDARGRKQYRYHPRFREVRDEHKYGHMAEFGRALQRIHERLDRDLALPGLPRDKVLATVVHLLEKSLIRVGNEEYAKENKSYGLTTLRNRHVKVEGSTIKFDFQGKSGVTHHIKLSDRRLAKVVAKLQELPGQELFQYCDDQSCRNSISSADVNAYLKEAGGGDFTAKDFRTWAGTVLALTELAKAEPPATKKQAKSAVTQVVTVVSKQLGNTPAVCRKCYIHPTVLESFASGSLREFLAREAEKHPEVAEGVLDCAEELVLDLLEQQSKAA